MKVLLGLLPTRGQVASAKASALGLLPTRGQFEAMRAEGVQRTLMRWAALPVDDRRWAAPLSAVAVGFGLFISVAIGPGISQTLGTAQQLVEAPVDGNAGSGAHKPATADASPVLGSPVDNTPTPPGGSPSVPAPSSPVLPPAPPIAAVPPAAEQPAPEPQDPNPTPPADDPKPEPVVFKGTVVRVNDAAASYVLATAKGQINAIHATKLPDAGTKLSVAVKELANGTYAEDGKEDVSGDAKKAKLQGLVTYADGETGAYTVSRKGASVLIHPDSSVQPPSAPAVGAQVTVEAQLTDAPDPQPEPPTAPIATPVATPPAGCGTAPEPPDPPKTIVTETARTTDIEFIGYSDFEGLVEGVCPDAKQLILSADDLRESGADLTFDVADDAGIDLSALKPGDAIDASAVIDQDTLGLSLTGVSSDEKIKGADDADLAQGDQSG